MRCAGVSLDTRARVSGVDLVLNGMGIRSVTFLNIRVFVAGLYLERRTRNPVEALHEQTKLVVITFLRDAERSRMLDAMRSGIDSQPARIKQMAQKNWPDFERRLPDPRKDGRMALAYAQGRLELRHNNKLAGSWNDPGLAEALFSMWLGQRPVDSDLKQGLLGGVCR
jgi:hypothetical protein